MFSSIGIPEILIILTAVLILFGGRKIPQLARDLGTGIREFKRSLLNARDGLDLEDTSRILNDKQSIPRNQKSLKKKSSKTRTKKRT